MRTREELNELIGAIEHNYHYSENPNNDSRHYEIEGTRAIVVRVALIFLEVLIDIRDAVQRKD